MMTVLAAGRFWIVWAVVSCLGSGLGYAIGLFPAVLAAAVIAVLRGGPVAIPVAAATIGLVIGAIVGAAQSILLPSAWGVGNRWIRQSIIGWTAGAALGSVVALVVGWLLFGPEERRSTPTYSTYLMEMATPVSGLVLGWALRSVPPRRPVRLSLWLAAHVVAVSGGWIGWRFLIGESLDDPLRFSEPIYGAVCYGVVSASVMLLVVRNRPVLPVYEPDDVAGDRTDPA